MIQAKIIMIGNRVLADYDEVEVLEIMQEQIRCRKLHPLEGQDDVYTVHLNNIYGIPLTPEILERWGFVERKGRLLLNMGIMGIEFSHSQGLAIWFDGEFSDFAAYTHGKYLHQLQNLYFALTGQELTAK